MATKKRGLGRGLDALLGDMQPDVENLDNSLQHFPLDVLRPGKYQPRMDMSQQSLEELAESIRAQGVVQPIVVRPVEHGHYEIIAGERRWRAAALAGLENVPVIIKDVSDRNAISMALIENIQRENLNPMEEANALHRLLEEFELTHQQVADAVGKSRATVTNLLRLRLLSPDVKRLLENGDIEMGHARALLALDADQQLQTASVVVEKGLSVRETEQAVKRALAGVQAKPQTSPTVSTQQLQQLQQLQNRLDREFAGQLKLKRKSPSQGQLLVPYQDLDELQQILDTLADRQKR